MKGESLRLSPRRRWLWVALSAFLLAAAFIGGVLTGNTYRLFDFLCPTTATSQRLTVDLVSEDGVRFPAGTMVALRECAYMQRFHMDFAVDKAVEFDPVPEGERDELPHSTTFRLKGVFLAFFAHGFVGGVMGEPTGSGQLDMNHPGNPS